MKPYLFFVILLASGVATGAGSFRLEAPVIVGETDAVLQYDDGTAYWISWGGLYRGVWFDITDFRSMSQDFEAEYLEFWFYHHLMSWDTATFYAELWNGDANGPVEQLDQTSMIATHYSANRVYYSPTIVTEADFWGLMNTSFSSGGWPCILSDNTVQISSHSFFSDDFTLWEPWTTGWYEPLNKDFFVRVGGTIVGLDRESWGAIKGLFR